MSHGLIVSVSGMRGIVGEDLTPELVSRHAAALGAWASAAGNPTVVLGRDARTSGPMFARAAEAGLMSVGVSVIDLGVVPTPTVQLAVEHHGAGAGLILTASHNPIEWNGLKPFSPEGSVFDQENGERLLELIESEKFAYVAWDKLGSLEEIDDPSAPHRERVLKLVDGEAIRSVI